MTLTWAYGVTTVPERIDSTLPLTLRSLAAAGFDEPRLFVDGERLAIRYEDMFGLPVSTRWPRIRTHGNWLLSIVELVSRNPNADRYAIFQDDLLTCKNLRGYLDQCKYPRDGYLNLYTFPENEAIVPPDPTGKRSKATGWFRSNQRGKGALGLVFGNAVVYKLLSSLHIWDRQRDPNRGWQSTDGGVVTALSFQEVSEYIHSSSLVQHIGHVSTMGHGKYPEALSFRGENFNALDLLTP